MGNYESEWNLIFSDISLDLPIGDEFTTASTLLRSSLYGAFSVFRIGVRPHVNWNVKKQTSVGLRVIYIILQEKFI